MRNHSDPPHGPGSQWRHRTLDEVFELLSKSPRRRILTSLLNANPSDETEIVPSSVIRNERRKDDSTRLRHIHLPKLEEADFIAWNPDSETVTRGPRFDEVAPLLELLVANREELPAEWP